MHIHPALWPAIVGATLGLPLLILWGDRILQRWKGWPQRRRTLNAVGLSVFALAYGLNIYAWLIEPNTLVVQRVEVISDNWRGAPLTIAAIGDPHLGGPHVGAARMQRIVLEINRLRPDLVVLLGDYANGHAPEAERAPREQSEILGGVATFAALTAPLGAVAVLGNHDSWFGRATITRALEDAGVATLWNRNVTMSRPGGDFVIAGLEDDWTGHPDFATALDGAPPHADTIVIAHSPDPFIDAPPGIALLLAGHAHCGQVTIPLLGRPILPLRNRHYGCHRIEQNGETIYVTAGIGTSGPPVRFLNPPEIVFITVRGRARDTSTAPA